MKLKFSLLLLVMSFAFNACEVPPRGNTGKDGYYFEKETFSRTDIPLHIILYPSSAALKSEYAKSHNSLAEGRELVAFSTLNTGNTETCAVHMVDPKVYYSPEFIGHEIVHCMYGEWHKIQP